MKTPDLIALLREFASDKVALLERHVAGAQLVSDYDFNNTYQYIINREDMQVGWLRDALTELGSALPASSGPSEGMPTENQHAVIADDFRHEGAFHDKWKPRVGTMTHARNRKMLDVVLGETIEHRRFFEQMLSGRTDLLGRRPSDQGTGGGVLPVRWLDQ